MTIDLRSDTVTRPTAAMRAAMAAAEVGDDVYGEDPTVRRLEEEAAAALGKESALFVPSGTMGNQIAIHLHTRSGEEVVAEAASHVIHYEMGAMAALSGVQPKPVAGVDGVLDPAVVRAAIVRDVPYQSRTGLVTVENTHNLAGGTVVPPQRLRELAAVAGEAGVPIHMDGARIFNAAVASGAAVAELAAGFDSVTFCLSKGLGAPVGSVLCGSAAFIVEARRVRKMLGGGMRQVGVLAAAGLLALDEGPQALPADHEHAALLAAACDEAPGIDVVVPPQTNILVTRLRSMAPAAFVAALAEQGVLAIPLLADRVRFVTHRDVSRDGIDTAIAALRRVLGG
ncbi:MAG: GntG family PLP-dependent aldolase [Thermoanaerobaculia bacterium]|nr:GntG family PLP-dependent aldolase [Thermoanaerobaculia bacterium]